MDTQGILTVFVGGIIMIVVSFWLHHKLAGSEGRPGLASMLAFVLGWLSVMTTLITGIFLLVVLLRQ
ncbi:MAG: hypothetical protein AB7P40_27280 [Chloroflexota bacterium]